MSTSNGTLVFLSFKVAFESAVEKQEEIKTSCHGHYFS